MGKQTLAEIKDTVQKADASLKRNDKTFRYAVMVLASALNELKTAESLRDFTHFQLRECFDCLDNLKKNGLGWQGEKFFHSGWDGGDVSFWMDVSVAMGYVEKAP